MILFYLSFNNYIHPAINSALLEALFSATIYQLQITSNYNISAYHSATSATVDYKNTLSQYISFKLHPTTIFRLAIQQPRQLSTTRTHYHNISASYYIRLQYFSLTFSNLSNCQLQVDYKNTLSQYISFKLHPTTIFWLAIQQPQQLLTTRTHYHNISASNYIQLQYFSLPFSNLSNCRLQEHIITIYQLQITSDYNISACHSATSATVNYKSTTRTHYHNISASNYIQLQYFGLPFSNLSNC